MMLTANSFARNVIVLAIAAGVHLALWFVFSRIPYSRVRQAEDFRGTWIVIEPRMSEQSKSATTSSLPPELRPEAESAAITLPGQSPATDTDAKQIDWRAEGERAAGDVVARTVPSAVAQARSQNHALAVFREPLHKNGDTQFLGDGEIITWVSDKCYSTNRPFAAPQLDENRLNVVCKDPFKDRTDFVDHLKPKYLQVLPVQERDQAVQGESDEASAPSCSYSTFRCK